VITEPEREVMIEVVSEEINKAHGSRADPRKSQSQATIVVDRIIKFLDSRV